MLFWPTLALIAIGLGSLGIYDISNPVTVSAYAALAVTVTAVMLLVGAFLGRPGGLIALGLVSSLALLVTSIVGAATGGTVDNRELLIRPSNPAALADSYRISTGSILIDLSRMRELSELDGRDLAVSLNAGDITVLVPEGLNVNVDADIRYAGEISVGDLTRGGFDQSVNTHPVHVLEGRDADPQPRRRRPGRLDLRRGTSVAPTARPARSQSMSDLNQQPPADRSVKITHLVFGLLFLGVAVVWALVVGDVINEDDLAVIAPAVLIVAGVIGLAASLASARNRRNRDNQMFDRPVETRTTPHRKPRRARARRPHRGDPMTEHQTENQTATQTAAAARTSRRTSPRPSRPSSG